ncbi:hypothetical protein INR49_003404 [Caranx melampygus]|nr:hypothetical protein INR49_003404 [Caranx melampygus]
MNNAPLRQKSIHLVIIVLAVFAVSYLPFHVMKNLNMRARLYFQSPDMCEFNNRVYATYQVTRGLASLNSCVDPILYFLAGDTFRRKLSRATKKPSRKGDTVLQSKSEETALNSLAEYVENGDRRLDCLGVWWREFCYTTEDRGKSGGFVCLDGNRLWSDVASLSLDSFKRELSENESSSNKPEDH